PAPRGLRVFRTGLRPPPVSGSALTPYVQSGYRNAMRRGEHSMRRFRLAAVGRPYADHKHGGVRAAASLVAAIAGAVALMLAVVAVVPDVSKWALGGPMAAPVDVTGLQERVESDYRTMLQEAASKLPDGVDATTALLHGPPAMAIVEKVRSSGSDLVVMGSRG